MPGLVHLNWRSGGFICLLAASLLLATYARARPTLVPAGDIFNSTNVPPPPPAWLPSGPLTLEQALRRALDSDDQIASLKAAVEVARQEKFAASDFKDPVVQAENRTTGPSASNPDQDLDDSRISAGAYIPNPFLMVPHVNARAADYRAAQADLNAATWLLHCDVRRLFSQIAFLTNDLAFTADLVRLNGEVLNAVQSRLGQGAGTASDLMTASRQYLQFQDDFDQTYHRYQLAVRELAAMLNIPPESLAFATNAVAPISLPAGRISFSQAEAQAGRSRWDLEALRWRAQAAESGYHEIRNEKVPWIKEVSAGYIDNSSKDSGNYWIGLEMDVPIFAWTKNHAADAARAKVTLASVNETNGVRAVRQELRDALDEVDETSRQQTRNDTTMQPLIATMRQSLTALKNTPNIMPEQVAAAELQLVQTLRYDLNTRWQYQLALFDLEKTLGAPLDQPDVPPANVADPGSNNQPKSSSP